MSFYSLENRKKGALCRVPDDGCIKISHFIVYKVEIGAPKIRHLIEDLDEGRSELVPSQRIRRTGAQN